MVKKGRKPKAKAKAPERDLADETPAEKLARLEKENASLRKKNVDPAQNATPRGRSTIAGFERRGACFRR